MISVSAGGSEPVIAFARMPKAARAPRALPIRSPAALLGLALALSACARNAALEVEIEVPPADAAAPSRYAVVQFETAAQSFESDWRGANEYPGALLGTDPQTLRYTVLSESPETVVQVKVLFCTTADCTGADDSPDRTPALWYRLERSLYVGERTRWRVRIASVPSDPPTTPIDVDKCEIEGCIRAGGSETSFCRLSGEHYCE